MALVLVQLTLLLVTFGCVLRRYRRRHALDRICARFVEAVADRNFLAADLHAGDWFITAESRRREPPPHPRPWLPDRPGS